MQAFHIVGKYTEDLLENHRTVKIGGWTFAWTCALVQDNPVLPILGTESWIHSQTHSLLLQVEKKGVRHAQSYM